MDNTQFFKRVLTIKANLQLVVDDLTSLENEIQKEGIKMPRTKKIDPRFAQLHTQRDQHLATRFEASQLQAQFKLKTRPHYTRVLQYRATKDPRVFDGLKREWE